MTRLDQNRAKSILGNKLNKSVTEISQLVVWGNHSATQFPDLNHSLVSNNDVPIKSLDQKWIEDAFIPRVQKRGAEIIEQLGFVIGLHTKEISKKQINFIRETLFLIDKI